MAAGLITGIDECSENGIELTQVQKIELTKMMLMAYHDAVRDFTSAIQTEEALQDLADEVSRG